MFTARICLQTSIRWNVRQFSTTTRTFPTGFRAAGVRCGIKKKKDMLDLAVVKSDTPCSAAAVFTTNQFKAGPVIACQQLLEKHATDIYGVVINSGCANACTGPKGIADAHTMSNIAGEHGIKNSLVMSTGVIGPFLDMNKIKDGITQATNVIDKTSVEQGWINASHAIMTTDTVPKLITRTFPLGSHQVTFSGICKGAGMIHPNMATMLSVIATDAAITPECLKAALKYAVDRSFNSMSVDGDTSTNDTLAVLANGRALGLSSKDLITSTSSPEFLTFRTALTTAAQDLAQLLVRDGEGATKFATIQVSGAKSYADAHTIASSIAQSSLVKTALYGQDANWGRILCAVGYAGIPIQPEKVNLWFVGDDALNERIRDNSVERARLEKENNGIHISSLHLVKDGRPHDVNEEQATALLRRKDIYIKVDLGLGTESATYWTCDFSLDYVKINADYRS